jgi:hypothetical protein
VLVFSISVVYNCNIIYKILGTEIWSGIGETARAEERNENENSDLHDRGGGEEGGGEGVQACHFTLAERPLRLFPGWRCPSAGCARG